MRFNVRDLLWAMVVVGLVIALYKEKVALDKEKERYTTVATLAHNLEMAFDSLAAFAVETGDWVIELEDRMLTVSPAADRKKQQFSVIWSDLSGLDSFLPLPWEWSPESLERGDCWMFQHSDNAP